MTRETLGLSDALRTYIRSTALREHSVARRLREETAKRPDADCQIAPEQGQFLALLVAMTGARRVLEIGCYTGYSALVMALALREDGYLLTLDVNEDTALMARRAWAEAGVGARVELRLGLAEESLAALVAEGGGDFDLAFIDADKKAYDIYYERALELVRPGGILVLDNMLWGGTVADPANQSRQTQSLRFLTEKARDDERVDTALLPIADGVLVACKR